MRYRDTLPIDPATGERPLFVPPDTPGYEPAYVGCKAVDANLVLEGGSMRVQFTAGVLDYFSDKGLFPKRIVGVSAGALSGFNYMVGARGRTCALNIGFCGDKNYMSLWSFLTTGNAFNAEMSFHDIPFRLIPYKLEEFTGSPCKLTAVATEVETCMPRYFEIDDPIEGMKPMRASAAMPFVSQAVEIDGRLYLDGGVADTIPIEYSLRTGYEKQIVVLTQDETFVQAENHWNDLAYFMYRKYPEFAYATTRRFELVNKTRRRCMELAEEGRIFLIMPKERLLLETLENDLRKLYRVYEQGYERAEELWPQLMAYMGIDESDLLE